MNKEKLYSFSSDWIAGFTQSDGSFIISFDVTSKGKIAVRPYPIFILTQSINELPMFEALQKYLSIGKLQVNRNNINFIVKSIDDIVKVLIPLFDKSPLRGNKLINYQIFKKVSLMIANKDHLTIEGTLQILELSYFMNKDTSLRTQESKEKILDQLKNKHGILPKIKLDPILPVYTDPIIPINIEFIRGQVDGDGSFNVSFRTNRRRVNVNFTVVHELSSISLLNELTTFFQCGFVYKLPSVAARYQVQTVDDILNKIYPVFKNIKFNTNKDKDFQIVIKVAEIIRETGYKNDDQLKQIVELAWNMKNEGINRKMTKEQYLNKFCSN